ncbi:hypothetical protein ACF0H5_002210 [Mactra antiquata]
MAKVAVIGAGAVGLSTALNTQQILPHASVTIIADRFTRDTTSHGAGGLFLPSIDHLHGRDPDLVTQWSVDGFKFYSSLASSYEAGDSGHMIMPGYVFSHKEIKNPLYKRLVYSFRELRQEELKKLGVDYEYGYQVTTVITDTSKFLPWLMRRFKDNGGTVENRTVQSFQEFVGKYDIVMNCSGFRARELCNDKKVYPIKGHLLRIKAPWIKYWVYTEDGAYFVPSQDAVAIGGIRQKDNYSLTADPKERAGILERCYKLWPSLKGAPIINEWVDLRPHRDPLRLETETMSFSNGSLKVVHNYGHGALGITLCWGTGLSAARMASAELMKNSKL